jgi:hypothetical protein
MKFGPPGKYAGDHIPVPVFYVLEIYQDTFRAEKRAIEIRIVSKNRWWRLVCIFTSRSKAAHNFDTHRR